MVMSTYVSSIYLKIDLHWSVQNQPSDRMWIYDICNMKKLRGVLKECDFWTHTCSSCHFKSQGLEQIAIIKVLLLNLFIYANFMVLFTCKVNLPQMYFVHIVDKLYGPVSAMGMCVWEKKRRRGMGEWQGYWPAVLGSWQMLLSSRVKIGGMQAAVPKPWLR